MGVVLPCKREYGTGEDKGSKRTDKSIMDEEGEQIRSVVVYATVIFFWVFLGSFSWCFFFSFNFFFCCWCGKGREKRARGPL